MAEQTRGRGRPSKYRPEFCETIIEVGEQGGWLCEMAEACDVHRNTFDNWTKEYPEFLEALSRAKQKAQAWFERRGREGLTADKFNSALWAKQMSARHPDEYTERTKAEVTGKDGSELVPDIRQTARAVLQLFRAAQAKGEQT